MEQCNAYLTDGRMLQCSRPIKKGDEIVRWMSRDVRLDFFERIDRVVVDTTSKEYVLGKITLDGTGKPDSVVVDFINGTTDVVHRRIGLGFVYKE